MTTVESLNVATGELHPIQEAFVEAGAMQSGYSTGAMVLATKALLEANPDPSESEIRDALERDPRSGDRIREGRRGGTSAPPRRCAARSPGRWTRVVESRPRRRAGVGSLRRHRERTATSRWRVPRIVVSPDVPQTAVVGKPETKVDALRLVKGNPAFTDDIEPRGMLFAKVLGAPTPTPASSRSTTPRRARSPASTRSLHYRNTPRVKYASGGQSWPNPQPWDQVSFDDKVRHVGDRVAAVAAETAEIAAEACRRIKVTYEVLPAVFDELEAIAPGAPVIHDEPDTEGIFDAGRNISHHIEGQTVSDEQLEAAFAGAARVFDRDLPRATGPAHAHRTPHHDRVARRGRAARAALVHAGPLPRAPHGGAACSGCR